MDWAHVMLQAPSADRPSHDFPITELQSALRVPRRTEARGVERKLLYALRNNNNS
jgi:hypothetical protein